MTTYFRKLFYANDPALYTTLTTSLTYDDGAVVYLNGVELFRVNMPAGAIGNTTQATTGIEDTTNTQSFNVAGRLVAGANILAVEVHQYNLASSDLHFQFSMTAQRNPNVPIQTETFAEWGDQWKFSATGSAPAAGWTGTAYNDSGWSAGNAILGFGDGHESTTVPYGSDPNNKYRTTYFRRTFSITNPALYTSLDIGAEYDDGIVVYINGTEVLRRNMPTGTITYSTLASMGIEDNTAIVRTANASMLVSGVNVIAVEVHQYNAASSDLHFNLKLVANRNSPVTQEVTRLYYYAGGQRVAVRENGSLYYLLTDHLGSTTSTVDASGVEVGKILYKPWGEVRYTSGTTPTDRTYTGQISEPVLGLLLWRSWILG